MQTYAGIDLHSSNNFVGVINEQDKVLYGKRYSNRLDEVLRALGKKGVEKRGQVCS